MAVLYSGPGNTPVNKIGYTLAGVAAAISFWDATTTAKPWLTDYTISVAAAGTIQIIFGRAASSSVIFNHLLAGSATITRRLETPFAGDQNGGSFYLQSGMNGLITVNLAGFEV